MSNTAPPITTMDWGGGRGEEAWLGVWVDRARVSSWTLRATGDVLEEAEGREKGEGRGVNSGYIKV